MAYVLLGGDARTVPTRKCHGTLNFGDTIKTDLIPTDLYYACLDGTFDWDRNGNGIYGEVNDGCDLEPNLMVTRLPLAWSNDVSGFVNKLIAYEKEGDVSLHFDILMTGAEMYGKIENQSDAEYNGMIIEKFGITPYWNGEVVKKYDTTAPGYNIDATFMSNELSKGYAFIDVQSHGSESGWEFSDGVSFNAKTVPNMLRNSGLTIITTNACLVNAFDKTKSPLDKCLSQYLIAGPLNGIVAFYGNSREGIGNQNLRQEGFSQKYEKAFYKTLFDNPTENKNYGKVVVLSKASFADYYNTNIHRWLQFGLNPIGDPEMPIYTAYPELFRNAAITKSGHYYIIDAGTDNATISITGKMQGKDYQKVYRNKRGAIAKGLPEDPVIVITKQNYKPLVLEGEEAINAFIAQPTLLIKEVAQSAGSSTIRVSLMPTREGDEMSIPQDTYLQLTDIVGSVKKRQPCEEYTYDNEIDVSSLAEGLYILTLFVDDCPVDTCRVIKK